MEPPPKLPPAPPGHEKEYALYERTGKIYHSRMEGNRNGDVKTVEGTYSGWTFRRSCSNAYAAIDVAEGTPFDKVSLTEPNPPSDPLERVHVTMVAQLDRITSLRWSSFGVGCDGQRALRVELADYRHIDGAARILGEWMVANKVSGEVTFDVCSVKMASPSVGIPKCGSSP